MNNVSLIGYVENDIEFREIPSKNTNVAHFLLQVKQPIKSNGKYKYKNVNVPIRVIGKGAITVSNYVKKGSKVAVTGGLDINIQKIPVKTKNEDGNWEEKELKIYQLHVLTYGVEFINNTLSDEELIEKGYVNPSADLFNVFSELYGSVE